jgi:hypothetical protein
MASPADRLTTLSNQAADLLAKAKDYRRRMDALPADDPLRDEYERIIRDLLSTANSLSSAVKSIARGA